MKQLTDCLTSRELEQRLHQPLAREEAQALAGHLEGCPRCARIAAAVLRLDDPVEATRRIREVGGAGPVPRLVVPCPGCARPLRFRPEMAGKKCKCPACGRVVVPPVGEERTLPPSDQVEEQTVPPGTEARSTSAVDDEPTMGVSAAGEEQEWDFLAPPQNGEEMGRLGSYRVLAVLGRGGMGVVFRAEDSQLLRPVALKAMLPTLAASPSARSRFLREARAAAALRHDHIVSIYQVGEDRGVPYLAMEFLEGEPLDARLHRLRKLPLPEVLRIGREMAEGLAAAHRRGLIHRDIKPANVWLDGESGRVKILDFGLARTGDDQANLTQQGAIVGTPAYMSPEQARGEAVDHRTDLFSLGCVLYRMATGRLAFGGNDTISTLLAVATENPRPPHEADPEVPRALSELILGLLAKEPAQRPGSAREVADALSELQRDPTEGLPPRRPARRAAPRVPPLPKRPVGPGWLRRWWWVAAACLLVVGGTAWLGAVVLRVETDAGTLVVELDDPDLDVVVRQAGVVVQDRTNKREFTLQPSKGKEGEVEVLEKGGQKITTRAFELKSGRKSRVRVTHEEVSLARRTRLFAPGAPGPFDSLRRQDIPAAELRAAGCGDETQAPAELVAVLGESRLRHEGVVLSLTYTPDSKRIISCSGPWDTFLRVWDGATGEQLAWVPAPPGLVYSASQQLPWLGVGFSPDGRRLAYSGRNGSVEVLDVETGRVVQVLKGHPQRVSALVYSPDGSRLATACDDPQSEVKVWDTASGKELLSIAEKGPVINAKKNRRWASLAFSPDGKRLAGSSLTDGSVVRIWDAATGKELLSRKLTHAVTSLNFTAGGKAVAAVVAEERRARKVSVLIWDAAGGNDLGSVPGRGRNGTVPLSCSPDGKHLAANLEGGEVTVRDAVTGREAFALRAQPDEWFRWLAFSPDGKRLAGGSYYGRVAVWDLASRKEVFPPRGHLGRGVQSVAVSQDGRWIASLGMDGSVRVWDSATGKGGNSLSSPKEGNVPGMALSPHGKLVAASLRLTGIKVWDRATGKELFELPERPHFLTFDPRGKYLATVVNEGKKVTIWHLASRTAALTLQGHEGSVVSAAFSPDGKLLATASQDRTVRLWNLSSGKEVRRIDSRWWANIVAFSPDGKQLLVKSGSGGGTHCTLWDAASGKQLRSYPALRGVDRMVWTPEGRFILDNHLRIVDAVTGEVRRAITCPVLARRALDVAITPDGRHVVAGRGDGTIHVYRLAEASRRGAK